MSILSFSLLHAGHKSPESAVHVLNTAALVKFSMQSARSNKK